MSKNNVKQVIVMRTDTDPPMRKGKMVAQGAHAALSFLTRRIQDLRDGLRMPDQFQKYGDFDLWGYLGLTPDMQEWIYGNFAKVCVRVDSEAELMEIYGKAKAAGVEAHLITDSGLTEFGGVPTKTCLALGPAASDKIDPITGHLKLL